MLNHKYKLGQTLNPKFNPLDIFIPHKRIEADFLP